MTNQLNVNLTQQVHCLVKKGINDYSYDYDMAFNCFKQAVELDYNIVVEYYLGQCYHYGWRIVRTIQEAVNWYFEMAGFGFEEADDIFIRCYNEESGITIEKEKALLLCGILLLLGVPEQPKHPEFAQLLQKLDNDYIIINV